MKISRRSFLRLIGFGGAATALPLPAPVASVSLAPAIHKALDPVWAPEYAWKSIVAPITFPPGRVAEVRAFIERAARDDDAAREWLASDLFAPKAPERSDAT